MSPHYCSVAWGCSALRPGLAFAHPSFSHPPLADRTDEADTVCCSGPNLAADACVDGVPTDCDYNCALILIPWFEDCSTLIGQLAGEQFGAYENAYNRCKQTDAPDLWMQIHNLQEQGCTVPLPAGDVATDAANNAAADACNLSGAPVHIDTCTASSEYSDDYTCDHVFDVRWRHFLD